MKISKSNAEVKGAAGGKCMLQLFIFDDQPHSARAITNIKAICEKHLKGGYELDIIDLNKKPTLALSEDIIAIPTLIKRFPLPEIRFIGDLSDTQSVLEGLSVFN